MNRRAKKFRRLSGLAALAVLAAGCTSFGTMTRRGWPTTARVEVCTNEPELVKAEWPGYGIELDVVRVDAPPRGGFTSSAVFKAVESTWLGMPGCRRYLIVYQATASDRIMWYTIGGVRGEVGWTDAGEAVGFAFNEPGVVAHELLHLIGCRTHDMAACQEHMDKIRKGMER